MSRTNVTWMKIRSLVAGSCFVDSDYIISVVGKICGQSLSAGVPHKLAYNTLVNVRAFFFGPILDRCYRKEGVIDQKW